MVYFFSLMCDVTLERVCKTRLKRFMFKSLNMVKGLILGTDLFFVDLLSFKNITFLVSEVSDKFFKT